MENWIKRKMALLAFALSKAETSALKQQEDALGNVQGKIQTFNQGTLADSLLKGEISLPVKELRWRLYKVLQESKSVGARIIGYDDDDLPIVETYSMDNHQLDKILRDDEDPYPVEMVVRNEALTNSNIDTFEKIDSNKTNASPVEEKEKETFDLVGTETDEVKFTHAELSFDEMMSTFKERKSIIIDRKYKPKFDIEDYLQKLIVRPISGDEKLLEFYVSMYPDEYNRKSRLFISEIKRLLANPRHCDFIEFDKVDFVTNKTLGAPDGLEYEYEILNYYKTIKFNGSYVIKFKAKELVNGANIFEKYKLDELEERYKNKEAK